MHGYLNICELITANVVDKNPTTDGGITPQMLADSCSILKCNLEYKLGRKLNQNLN